MSLTVHVDEMNDLAVVRLAGRIEPANFQALGSALSQLLHDGRRKIILDSNKLDYLNTAEVPLLFRFEEEAHAQGGDIKWDGLNNELASVISLLDSGHEQQIFDDLEGAIKAFRDGDLHSRTS